MFGGKGLRALAFGDFQILLAEKDPRVVFVLLGVAPRDVERDLQFLQPALELVALGGCVMSRCRRSSGVVMGSNFSAW